MNTIKEKLLSQIAKSNNLVIEAYNKKTIPQRLHASADAVNVSYDQHLELTKEILRDLVLWVKSNPMMLFESPEMIVQSFMLSCIKECDTHCGMNYCDENGCMDRKRVQTPEPWENDNENGY